MPHCRLVPILVAVLLAVPVHAAELQVDSGAEGSTLSVDGTLVHTTAAAVSDGHLVHVPGSDTLLLLWEETEAQGAAPVPHTAIALDGSSFWRARQTSYELELRAGSFDPLVGELELEASPWPEGAHGELYLVQFHTQPLEVFREQIRDLGGTVWRFLPNHAHIVQMSPAVRDRVVALPYVRWVGPYRPDYRLGDGTAQPPASARYNVQVFERGPRQKAIVAARIRALGGTIDAQIPDGFLLEATLTPAQLHEVVTWDEVIDVDRWGAPETDMELVRVVGGADYVESITGYSGQGVRCEVMDGSIRPTHVDFQTPSVILHGTVSGSSDHGTKCSGIVFGDGTGQANGRGMVPDLEQSYFASYLTVANRYTHSAELVAAPYECVFQSNSWGGARTLSYTGTSMQMDDIILLNDLVICQSQSNAGDQMSRPQAWAKNIVSVGGVRHYNDTDRSNDAWVGSASIGPAEDGRIKPDLCFYYDSIRTVDDNSDTAYTTGFGGTSAATPMTAGHFGIFFQMWNEGVFGNSVPVPGGTVFQNRPHSATAKAFLINAAEEYPFTGPGHDLTRVHQGWGVPDVANLYDRRDTYYWVDETEVLTNMTSAMHNVFVVPGTPLLKVTMVYQDVAGTTSASQHRINDLTLRVTSPSSTVYYGNNGLLVGNWSTPGGSSNTLDTVENVFVQTPEAGQWVIEVLADEVNADSHLETPAVDADFALVASGVSDVPVGCSLSPPMAPAYGEVSIGFDTHSFIAATLDTTLDFSTDGGTTWQLCTAAPGSSIANPATGVTPGPGSFLWDSRTDGVAFAATAAGVIVRMAVDDAIVSTPPTCTTVPFDVVPEPPTCSAAVGAALLVGPVDVTLSTASIGSVTVDVTVEYSVDGGATWNLCTADMGSALANPAAGVPVGMAIFSWDSDADGVGLGAIASGVLARATVDNGVSPLTAECSTAPFDVVPPPPACILTTPASPAMLDVTVPFDVSSPSAGTVSVVIEYSTDAGLSFAPCTAAAASPISNPSAPIATGSQSFVWNSVVDLGAATVAGGTLLSITVTDAVSPLAGTCTSNPFDVVPEAPTCTLAATAGVPVQFVTVDYTPSSAHVAAVDVTFAYSLDAGVTYSPCTAAPGSSLPNPATGVPTATAQFTWDALVDGVGAAGPVTGVQMRALTDDGVSPLLGECVTGPFDVLPPPPSCSVTTPSSPALGEVRIDCTTASLTAAAATVDFEYSVDAGGTWAACSAAAASPLPNPAPGVPLGMLSFDWDTALDGVGVLAPVAGVLVRVNVDDGISIVTGSCTTNPFDVDNLTPTCVLAAPPGVQWGAIDLVVTTASSRGTAATVTIEVSTDGGVTYIPCTTASGSANPNPTPPLPYGPVDFTWQSQLDVSGPLALGLVTVRATVDDGVSPGTGSCTADVDIDNRLLCGGLCGDCNQNGTGPDILDSLASAQIAAGILAPSLDQEYCCDVDSSTTVTVLDALLMAQSAAGLAVPLTCR